MTTERYSVTRAKNYPFLTLQKVREGAEPHEGVISLTGDELEDYEQALKKFAAWQERIANADGPSMGFVEGVGVPAGGAKA